MNRVVPLLVLVAVAVAVSACGHPALRAATTTSPTAAPSPSPSATPLIEDTLIDRYVCSDFTLGFETHFTAATPQQLNADVNNTSHHVDPVLVQDVNTWLTDSQRQGVSSDSTDVNKIFADCHSIGQ